MRKLLALLFLSSLFCRALFAENGNPSPVSIQSPPSTMVMNSLPTENPTDSPTLTTEWTNPIRIVYPAENARLPALSSTYVGGSAPADGKLTINGKPVPIHPGGGFLALIDLVPGAFQIQVELEWGELRYLATRTIQVGQPELPALVSPLTITYVTPQQDQQLLPGDLLNVVCKGSPGMVGYFTIQGIARTFPMIESKAASGVYQGIYRLGNQDKLNQSKITVTLVDQNNGKESKEAGGTLSLFPDDFPVMAETTSSNTVLRAGPKVASSDKAGYMMFLPKETLFQITGKKGDEYRVRLNKNKTAWISSDQMKQLPPGTLPNDVAVGSIALSTDGQSTIIRIPLAQKIPFKIDPDGEGRYIDISLFGAFSNTDWINNASAGSISQLSWFQDDEETYRLRAYTTPNGWWGYDVRYEENQLIVELRTPPPLDSGKTVLDGLTVAVDAGHGTGGGAMGLTGYAEGDANFAMVNRLKETLLVKGAKVIMIRTDNADVPLNERTGIAWQNRADILISVHNNSLGSSGNPFQKHGYGVYYFTPMSLPLAKEIHAAYGETFTPGSQFNLPDDGLYYANLALTRAPQMPSVLIESAYMIVPEEEAYLKTEGFRTACVNAIVTGLERYVGRMRK